MLSVSQNIMTEKQHIVTQQEFDELVSESELLFSHSHAEAIIDAFAQFRLQRADASRICAAPEEACALAFIQTILASNSPLDLFNLPKIKNSCRVFEPVRLSAVDSGLLGKALRTACVGGDVECKTQAFELVEILCDRERHRQGIPAVALEVVCLELTKALSSGDFGYVQSGFSALTMVCKNCERNKQNLNHRTEFEVLVARALDQPLMRLPPVVQMEACRALRAYLTDDDKECEQSEAFTRARKLGEESDMVAKVAKWMRADDTFCQTLRILCVNDSICTKALDCGAMEEALKSVEHSAAVGTSAKGALLLLRHLCLSDDAKTSLGLGRGSIVLLEFAQRTDPNDEEMGLICSILGALTLRQAEICSRLADSGCVDLVIRITLESDNETTLRQCLLALRNFVAGPLNDSVRAKALENNAESACRRVGGKMFDFRLKEHAESCLRDLGLNNYRVVS